MKTRPVLAVVAGAVVVAAGLAGSDGAAAASRASVQTVAGPVVRSVPLPDTEPDGEWWFPAWGIPKVWAVGARGQGVTVAVIDTGVQASFPEMRGVVLPGTNFQGGDGRTDESPEASGNRDGHGTAMAIDIAGQGGPFGLVGVAPEAKILPVVRRGKAGDQIRWAVDHGAKVVNMSFNYGGSCNPDTEGGVRYALDHGAVVVTGTGNDGSHGSGGDPAGCPGIVAAGAVDSDMRLWDRSNQGSFVGVAAPGVHIPGINLDRQQGIGKGTSDASALTSGAVALVWSKFPKLTNRQVVARLLATAVDAGPVGRDDGFGYGVISPYRAITMNAPLDAPNPIFDQAYVSASPAPSSAASPTGAVGSTASGRAGSASSGGGSGGTVLWVLGGGLALLLVAGLVVAIVVRSSSRRRGPAPGPIPPGYAGPPYPTGFPAGPAAPPTAPGYPAPPGYPPPTGQPGYPPFPPGQGPGQPPVRG